MSLSTFHRSDLPGETPLAAFRTLRPRESGHYRLLDRTNDLSSKVIMRCVSRVSVGPPKRFRGLLVMLDVSHQLASQSATEVKIPRAITSRSILENQSSTWFSQDEWMGV